MTDQSPTPSVSSIQCDRPCTKCGFNLHGQLISREPHYQLLIARCPECGQVTSLQEYPTLSRAAGRWVVALGILWLLALFGAFVATFGLHIAAAEVGSEGATQEFGAFIAEKHLVYQSAKSADAQANQFSAAAWSQIDKTWWDSQNPRQLLEDAGGISGLVSGQSLVESAAFAVFVLFPLGVFWSVALCHSKRIMVCLLMLTAGAIALVFQAVSHNAYLIAGGWAFALAESALGMKIRIVAIVAAQVFIWTGVFCGRPLARLGIRILLPPRLRQIFGGLWRCDGKEPPGNRSHLT